MFTRLVRYRRSIAVVAIVASGSALYFSRQQTSIYASETMVLIEPITLSEGAEPQEPNLSTEERLAVSTPVAELVVDSLGLAETPSEILRGITVESVSATEILTFTYEHPDPAVAAERSRAFADSYLDYRLQRVAQQVSTSLEVLEDDIRTLTARISELINQIPETPTSARGVLRTRASLLNTVLVQKELAALRLQGDSQVGRVVESAGFPSSPIRPNHNLNVVLGLVLGLLLGGGQAVLRARLSPRIWSTEELEAITGQPVLGAIPGVPRWRKRGSRLLITHPKTPQKVVEAFRFLRGGVMAAASARAAKVLLVTSVDPGAGRSTTAVNLAIALAKVGRRVLFVSADFRRSGLDDVLRVSGDRGLSDVLLGQMLLRDALIDVSVADTPMRVLPRGGEVVNPAEMLGSGATELLLEDLRKEADFVVVDASPISGFADAVSLAPATDAVLLVVHARRGNAATLRTVCRRLEQIRVPLLGSVFNRANLGQLESRSYGFLQESLMTGQAPPGRPNGVRPSRPPAGRRR